MPRMTLPAAVLVDLDNTLHDYRLAAGHFRSAFSLYVEQRWGVPRRDVLAFYEQLISADEDEVFASGFELRVVRMRKMIAAWPQMQSADPEHLAHFIRTMLLDAVRPFAGAIEAYEALSRKVCTMIVTEGYADIQTDICKCLGLNVESGAFLATKAHGVRKRDGSAFRLAQGRLGAPADEIVVVGDNWSWDIEAAAKVGMWQLWVGPAPPGKETPVPQRYLGQITAFREVPAFLSSNWECRDQKAR